MKELIYLSFVTASISFTMTETRLFLKFREWVKRKSSFLGELLSCGYCFCHWTALVLIAVYRRKALESSWSLPDYFFTALIIAWLAAFQWILLCWMMAKVGK